MTATDITNSLRSFYTGKHSFRLFNSFVFAWECDYFGMTDAGYTVEVEIKVSKADFKADFFKEKHKYLAGYHTGKPFFWQKTKTHYGFDRELIRAFYPNELRHSIDTHTDIQQCYPKVPNKFYFACPEGLLKPDDVPAYAGLLWIGNHTVQEVKKAPFVTKNKPDLKARLLDKFYFKSIDLQTKLRDAKSTIIYLQREMGQISEEEATKQRSKIHFEL